MSRVKGCPGRSTYHIENWNLRRDRVTVRINMDPDG